MFFLIFFSRIVFFIFFCCCFLYSLFRDFVILFIFCINIWDLLWFSWNFFDLVEDWFVFEFWDDEYEIWEGVVDVYFDWKVDDNVLGLVMLKDWDCFNDSCWSLVFSEGEWRLMLFNWCWILIFFSFSFLRLIFWVLFKDLVNLFSWCFLCVFCCLVLKSFWVLRVVYVLLMLKLWYRWLRVGLIVMIE